MKDRNSYGDSIMKSFINNMTACFNMDSAFFYIFVFEPLRDKSNDLSLAPILIRVSTLHMKTY